MNKSGTKWRREELILAFALYCRIPFSRVNSRNPEIIRIAEIIGRKPSAVNFKVGNFGSFDPQLKKRGIDGLSHASKLDKAIWEEFNENLPELAAQAFIIENKMSGNENIILPDEPEREGGETIRPTRQRINQKFFRETILAAYNGNCCITGINIPAVLVASHIKPWAECSPKEQLNPRNGLCLNALHDRAFDRGLITITGDFRIKISGEIRAIKNAAAQKWLCNFDGQKINLPDKFMPSANFLAWHERHIFNR